MLNKINIGIEKDSGTGDTLRQGAVKINNNFEEIYNVLGLNGQSGDGNVAFVDTEQTLTNKTIQSSKTDSIINYDPINIPNSIKELYPDNHLLKATEDPFINTSYGSFSNYFFDEILPSISPDFENDLKVKFGIDDISNYINNLPDDQKNTFIQDIANEAVFNIFVNKKYDDFPKNQELINKIKPLIDEQRLREYLDYKIFTFSPQNQLYSAYNDFLTRGLNRETYYKNIHITNSSIFRFEVDDVGNQNIKKDIYDTTHPIPKFNQITKESVLLSPIVDSTEDQYSTTTENIRKNYTISHDESVMLFSDSYFSMPFKEYILNYGSRPEYQMLRDIMNTEEPMQVKEMLNALDVDIRLGRLFIYTNKNGIRTEDDYLSPYAYEYSPYGLSSVTDGKYIPRNIKLSDEIINLINNAIQAEATAIASPTLAPMAAAAVAAAVAELDAALRSYDNTNYQCFANRKISKTGNTIISTVMSDRKNLSIITIDSDNNTLDESIIQNGDSIGAFNQHFGTNIDIFNDDEFIVTDEKTLYLYKKTESGWKIFVNQQDYTIFSASIYNNYIAISGNGNANILKFSYDEENEVINWDYKKTLDTSGMFPDYVQQNDIGRGIKIVDKYCLIGFSSEDSEFEFGGIIFKNNNDTWEKIETDSIRNSNSVDDSDEYGKILHTDIGEKYYYVLYQKEVSGSYYYSYKVFPYEAAPTSRFNDYSPENWLDNDDVNTPTDFTPSFISGYKYIFNSPTVFLSHDLILPNYEFKTKNNNYILKCNKANHSYGIFNNCRITISDINDPSVSYGLYFKNNMACIPALRNSIEGYITDDVLFNNSGYDNSGHTSEVSFYHDPTGSMITENITGIHTLPRNYQPGSTDGIFNVYHLTLCETDSGEVYLYILMRDPIKSSQTSVPAVFLMINLTDFDSNDAININGNNFSRIVDAPFYSEHKGILITDSNSKIMYINDIIKINNDEGSVPTTEFPSSFAVSPKDIYKLYFLPNTPTINSSDEDRTLYTLQLNSSGKRLLSENFGERVTDNDNDIITSKSNVTYYDTSNFIQSKSEVINDLPANFIRDDNSGIYEFNSFFLSVFFDIRGNADLIENRKSENAEDKLFYNLKYTFDNPTKTMADRVCNFYRNIKHIYADNDNIYILSIKDYRFKLLNDIIEDYLSIIDQYPDNEQQQKENFNLLFSQKYTSENYDSLIKNVPFFGSELPLTENEMPDVMLGAADLYNTGNKYSSEQLIYNINEGVYDIINKEKILYPKSQNIYVESDIELKDNILSVLRIYDPEIEIPFDIPAVGPGFLNIGYYPYHFYKDYNTIKFYFKDTLNVFYNISYDKKFTPDKTIDELLQGLLEVYSENSADFDINSLYMILYICGIDKSFLNYIKSFMEYYQDTKDLGIYQSILQKTLSDSIQYMKTLQLENKYSQSLNIDTFSNFVNQNFINNNNQSSISYLHEYNILKNNLIDSSLIVNSNILLPTSIKGSNKITKITASSGDNFLQKNKVTLQPNESFKSNLKGKYEIMDSVDPLISADCYFNGNNINIITVSDDISETISDSDKIVITVDGSDIKVTNKFSTQKEIIIFQK